MSLFKNVVCPGCTCLCDDIEITQNGSAVGAKNACDMGQAFFDVNPPEQPTHFVANQPADLDFAVESAAKILNQSQAPLICGMDQLTTQAQQTAWKIADHIGATIDTTLTDHGRASMFALQRGGMVTANVGEIAVRSDLVVFWFCDPENTHPRLLERMSRLDGPKRRIVVIDENATATAKKADAFLHIKRDNAPAVLAVLRAVVKGLSLDASLVQAATGLELNVLQTLAEHLQAAKYGSLIFGQTIADSSFDLVTDSLISMVRELNHCTRFVGMKLRSDTNAQSAENVLSWSSGYPFAVNHNHGLPRFNGLEHSAETVLRRRECDAILFASGADLAQSFAGLSSKSREFVGTIPSIVLSPILNFPSSVSMQVSTPGLDGRGEFCRFDDVSLPLTSISSQAIDTIESEVALEKLLTQLRSMATPTL